jgi:hypothetical protein
VERARELLALQSRVRDAAPAGMLDSPARVDYVAAHVAIEQLVASGYGLDRDDLRRILDPDPTIRRGFWRHYGADPNALLIAEALTDTHMDQAHMTRRSARWKARKSACVRGDDVRPLS